MGMMVGVQFRWFRKWKQQVSFLTLSAALAFLTVMAITNQSNTHLGHSSATIPFVMAFTNTRAGQQMCEMRERLGLTMRDVHRLSKQAAKSLRNSDYIVSPSRLCDIERKGTTPNLYRLHALSLTYDCKLEQLLKFYGIVDGRGGGRRPKRG